MPINLLDYSCIKKLQRDNLLHAYNEPMNIYSVVLQSAAATAIYLSTYMRAVASSIHLNLSCILQNLFNYFNVHTCISLDFVVEVLKIVF